MDWISSWKVTGMFLEGIFLIFSTLNKIQSFFLAPQEAKHSVQEFALSTPSLVQTHPLDWMRCSSSDKIWSLWKKPVWTQFLEVYYNFSYGSCQGNVWSPAKLHTDPPSPRSPIPTASQLTLQTQLPDVNVVHVDSAMSQLLSDF